MFPIFRISLVASGIALWLSCSWTPITALGGTGSETVIGIAFDAANHVAANTQVMLIPENYKPLAGPPLDNSHIDTTDANGEYRFARQTKGRYRIQAVHLLDRTRFLIAGITVQGDTTYPPPGLLKKTGTIKVILPDSVDATSGYVYIPGTTIFVLLNHNDSVALLDSIPAGTIPSINYSLIHAPVQSVIRYNIPVTSGDTSIVIMPAWKYSQKISLNTTSTGANVSGTVYGFPALIRLTSSNFNFAQAKTNGDDIRFTKANGALLPYEIEQWDVAQARAAIWVRIDMVFGNNSTQSIAMYWGNSAATGVSNGHGVFDTGVSTGGYEAVWHMNNDPAGDARNAIKDATINGNDLTPSGSMTSTNLIDGPIGKAISLDGTNDCLSKTVSRSGRFTLSLWVKAATLGQPLYASVFSNYSRMVLDTSFQIQTNGNDSYEFYSEGGVSLNSFTFGNMTTDYVFITLSFDQPTLTLYYNGLPVSSNVYDFPIQWDSYKIGLNRNNDQWFGGTTDEVVIARVVRSADWIKLCYMNQKPSGDALTVFDQTGSASPTTGTNR